MRCVWDKRSAVCMWRQSGKESEMNRFWFTLHFQDFSFPLLLCFTCSSCVFKLSAAYAKSQQGQENRALQKKIKKQIIEILERLISNMPELFNSFYPVGKRLMLLASWRAPAKPISVSTGCFAFIPSSLQLFQRQMLTFPPTHSELLEKRINLQNFIVSYLRPVSSSFQVRVKLISKFSPEKILMYFSKPQKTIGPADCFKRCVLTSFQVGKRQTYSCNRIIKENGE